MEDKIFEKLDRIEAALSRIADALENSNALNEKIERRHINTAIKEKKEAKRTSRRAGDAPRKIRLDQDLNQ